MGEDSPKKQHGSYTWVIPLIAVFVVTAAVIMGLFVFNEQVPLDTVPEPPEELPPAQTLYRNYCATCHGADGLGVARRYPPLVDTHWVLEDSERLVLITLHGLTGPIEVRGQTYDDYMPPLGHRLSDEEIAHLLTYVRNSWGNDAGAITADEVSQTRQDHPHPRDPWTAEELADRNAP